MSEVTQEKITVVIPVYNVAKYISYCLESVIGQTLKEWEAICIDDGSTDSSWQVLDEYARRDDRIRIFHQDNHGVSYTRNRAIDLAKGKYLFFLDPDDWLYDKKVFEDLFEAAEKQNVFVCGGSFQFVYPDHHTVSHPNNHYSKMSFTADGRIQYSDYQFDYAWTRFLYNREFLNTNGLRIPDYTIYEDPVFFVNVMIRAKEFYALKRIVYCYRRAYKTREYTYRNVLDFMSGICDIIRIANKEGYADLKQLQLIRLKTYYGREAVRFLGKDDSKELRERFNELNSLLYEDNKRIEYEIYQAEIDKLRFSRNWKTGEMILYLPRKIWKANSAFLKRLRKQ